MIRALGFVLLLASAAIGGFAAGTSSQLLHVAADVVGGCR